MLLKPLPDSVQSTGCINAFEAEIDYFRSDDAIVTNKRAILLGKTYAMNNVTNVAMAKVYACGAWPILIICISILVCCLGGLLNLMGLIGFGLVFLVGAMVGCCLLNRRYVVCIGSASGKSNALISKDQSYVKQIVDAMNKGIVESRRNLSTRSMTVPTASSEV